MKKSKTKRFGVLTAGGDAPGLNPAIRAICKAGHFVYGMEIVGIKSGFKGLVEGHGNLLMPGDYSGIIHKGGTILGTSRERPFRDSIKVQNMLDNYKKWDLDCVVCMGGNGTQKRANWLREIGLNVIGIPKTIDNDVFGTDMTFGFHTALEVATDAVDRLHTTAESHKRILIAEIMGNSAGWLALYAGIGGGSDVIIIPEIPYDIDIVVKKLEARMEPPHGFAVIAVAEGAKTIDEAGYSDKKLKKIRAEQESAGYRLSKEIEKKMGEKPRVSVLGYVQRGGSPSGYDRVLATQFGTKAAELMAKGDYGKMVSVKGQEITSVPLEDVAEKTKRVPIDHLAIESAKLAGTCFGD